MAGLGKRMRPHTLTIPKPLFPIAGKTIVQRLVECILEMTNQPIEEIAFVIGDFGKEVEKMLVEIIKKVSKTPIKTSIYYQEEALGTAHAILCAQASLKGNVIIAFADTLFSSNFKIDTKEDGVIWVHKVENPSSFGVVKVDKKNVITDFVEKPDKFVSDLAIIGIYYFKDGKMLKEELQYLIDNNIKDKGEFQLTNAMENMKNKGVRLIPGEVHEWLDCGNKDATLHTNQQVLKNENSKSIIDKTAKINNSNIIAPCYIGPGCEIDTCIIGPYASIEHDTIINNSIISKSIIQSNSILKNANICNAIIGNYVNYHGYCEELNLGDYSHNKC